MNTGNLPWGDDGIVIAYLDQSARFLKSTSTQEASVFHGWNIVNITDNNFELPSNTSYHTLIP